MPFWQYDNGRFWNDYRSDDIPDPRVKLNVEWYELDVAIESGIPVEWGEWVLHDVMIFTSGRVLLFCSKTWRFGNSLMGMESADYADQISDTAILVAARAAWILPEAHTYSVH